MTGSLWNMYNRLSHNILWQPWRNLTGIGSNTHWTVTNSRADNLVTIVVEDRCSLCVNLYNIQTRSDACFCSRWPFGNIVAKEENAHCEQILRLLQCVYLLYLRITNHIKRLSLCVSRPSAYMLCVWRVNISGAKISFWLICVLRWMLLETSMYISRSARKPTHMESA